MLAAANASSVGAKTVKGPSPPSVSANSACTNAASSEVWTFVHPAVVAMLFGVSVGVSTVSMTWITPLLAIASVAVTTALFTMTVSDTLNDSG